MHLELFIDPFTSTNGRIADIVEVVTRRGVLDVRFIASRVCQRRTRPM
jgi:hypothetical protein